MALVQRHMYFPINPTAFPTLSSAKDDRYGTASYVLLPNNLLLVIHIIASNYSVD